MRDWGVIEKEINEELEKFNKRIKVEELCLEYHKTRSIDAACRLADLLYELNYAK